MPPPSLDQDLGLVQGVLIIARPCCIALRRPCLAQYMASTTLRDPEILSNMHDAASPSLGAQKFPDEASFRMSLSSVRSATA
jgi:hypothetical protein